MHESYFDKLSREHKELEAIKRKHMSVSNLEKILGIKGIENLDGLKMQDCELNVSDLIVWATKRIRELDKENQMLANSLESIYDSGQLNKDGVDIARTALGLNV